MALSVNIIPGGQLGADELLSNAKLNLMARPVAEVTGTADATAIADGAVTRIKAAIGAFWYGVDSGTTDAYVVTYETAIKPSAWVDGALFVFKAATANSGAATFSPNSLTAKAIVTPDNQPLRDGAIPALGIVAVRYSSSIDKVVLESAVANGVPLVQSAVTTASHATVLSVTTTTYAVTVPAYIKSDYSGADGRVILFQAPAANQGQVSITPVTPNETNPATTQTLAARPVYKNGGTVLAAADIAANQWLEVIYDADANAFQLLSPVNAPAVPVPPRDLGRNIVMTWLSATTFKLTADEIVLKNASGDGYVAQAVDVTIDMAVNGPNGLEYASGGAPQAVAASTLYWGWVIYNGTTVAGLASLSKTAPELGSSYTYKALVCAIRTSSGTNLIETYYRDKTYAVKDSTTLPTTGGVRTAQHPFDQTPSYFRGVIYCNDTDAGYAVGREVGLTAVRNFSDFALPYHDDADATYVKVVASSVYAASMGINNGSSGAFGALVPTKWSFKFYFRE